MKLMRDGQRKERGEKNINIQLSERNAYERDKTVKKKCNCHKWLKAGL